MTRLLLSHAWLLAACAHAPHAEVELHYKQPSLRADDDAQRQHGSVEVTLAPVPRMAKLQGDCTRTRIAIEDDLQLELTITNRGLRPIALHGTRPALALDARPVALHTRSFFQAAVAPGQTSTFVFDVPDAQTFHEGAQLRFELENLPTRIDSAGKVSQRELLAWRFTLERAERIETTQRCSP